MNKKANTPLAILILTAVFFLIVGYAGLTFLTKGKEVKLMIQGASILESVYAEESQINLYIQTAATSAAKNTNLDSNPETIFIQNLKGELSKYKTGNVYILPELRLIEPQLKEENTNINEDTISITLRIKIDEKLEDEGYELLSAEYIYDKTFIGNLPEPPEEETS